jgi:hypothetical protein
MENEDMTTLADSLCDDDLTVVYNDEDNAVDMAVNICPVTVPINKVEEIVKETFHKAAKMEPNNLHKAIQNADDDDGYELHSFDDVNWAIVMSVNNPVSTEMAKIAQNFKNHALFVRKLLSRKDEE